MNEKKWTDDERDEAFDRGMETMQRVALELYRRGREPLLEELETVKRERDEARAEVEKLSESAKAAWEAECVMREQRDRYHAEWKQERQEVDHLRVKVEAYGGMVHGCGPALESAGHPIDPFQPDGRVGGIARSVAALVKERDEAQREVARLKSRPAEAEIGRLDVMWQQLVRERDEARAEVERLRAAVHTRACRNQSAYNLNCVCGADDYQRDLQKLAYRRGAEAMREACARWMSEREGIAQWVYDDALSALPIPEEP